MKKLSIFLLLFFFHFNFAQNNSNNSIQVSILTVGTADASHSLYGHTAIRVKNPANNTDLVYNYGMFDFRTPNFVLRFVKGDMQYFAAAYPYNDFEYSYRYENRSIYEQVLDLPIAKKQALIKALEASISGEEKFYTYKFIDRNCTTKVVDIVNSVLPKETIYKHDVSETSYRAILYPYAENHFFQKLGINLIFGTKTDQQATQLFLPFDLKNNLEKTQLDNKPLVSESKTLFEANRVPEKTAWDSIYTLLVVLALIVIINKKSVTTAYFSILGILGMFFSLVGLYSYHEEIYFNYNVLLFNPILPLIAYFDWKKNRKGLVYTSYIALACLFFYFLFMLTKIHLEIVWPFMLANAMLLVRRIYLTS